jgi:lysophospholipase L1-like esterase
MGRLLIWMVFCGLMAVVMGCERKEPGSAGVSPTMVKPAGVSKYLALGDSYTIGQGVGESERFPVQLAAALKKEGVDLGEPTIIARTGWTTRNLLDAMDREKPKSPYELVTVLIGVNNQFQGRAMEEYRGELKAVLERAVVLAGGKASHVVGVSIPDWGATPMGRGQAEKVGKEIDAFNEVMREECKKLNILVVDVTGISRLAAAEPDLLAADGLHPSGKMYGLWVKALAADCRSAIESRAAE